jgi:hypothetical protein
LGWPASPLGLVEPALHGEVDARVLAPGAPPIASATSRRNGLTRPRHSLASAIAARNKQRESAHRWRILGSLRRGATEGLGAAARRLRLVRRRVTFSRNLTLSLSRTCVSHCKVLRVRDAPAASARARRGGEAPRRPRRAGASRSCSS